MNERLAGQRDLTAALNEELHSLSATVSSADRSVSVQVDGWGAMTGLWLREHAYRGGADALADQIVKVADAASQLVADRQAFLLRQFGDRSNRLRDEAD